VTLILRQNAPGARFAALGRPDVINKLAARTGINQRFYSPENWVTSDLALTAAKEALKRAGRQPEDVDLIILGTMSPDYVSPSTSVVLQHKLGAKNAGAFDVNCACAAFPALVAIGAGLIATNAAMKTVLLVAVDMIHSMARIKCRKNGPTIIRASSTMAGTNTASGSFSAPNKWAGYRRMRS
jgi:3-oxoacyl-[acyl-carrier-protein] synthase III